MLLDGGAEAFLGEAEIVAAEIFLAELQVVVGIVAEEAGLRQRRDRLAARPRLGRLGHDRSGGRRRPRRCPQPPRRAAAGLSAAAVRRALPTSSSRPGRSGPPPPGSGPARSGTHEPAPPPGGPHRQRGKARRRWLRNAGQAILPARGAFRRVGTAACAPSRVGKIVGTRCPRGCTGADVRPPYVAFAGQERTATNCRSPRAR